MLINFESGDSGRHGEQCLFLQPEEVCKATVAFIDDPSCDLLDIMPAPDFQAVPSTHDRDQMKAIYQMDGAAKLRGRYTVDRKNNLIEVSEIPYSTTIEQIIKTSAGKSNQTQEVLDVHDETDLNSLK